jgi:hypothetical protein
MIKIMRMQTFHYLGAGSLTIAPAWSQAGVVVTLGTITFEPIGASSIPTLGGTMLILLAVLLGFVAIRQMRSGGGRGSAGMLLVGALVAGTLASGLGGFGLLRHAVAGGGSNTITDPGGATFPINEGLNVYTNNSGVTQRVADIDFTQLGEEICNGAVPVAELAPNGSPECQEDAQLAQGATCEIDCQGVGPSDVLLKTDIKFVGRAENGLPLYEFRYIGGTSRYRGVMAQDVLLHMPEAVVTLPNGYLGVDYGMLGLRMTRVQ